MNMKQAVRIRKSMKTCKVCPDKNLPTLTTLTESVEVVYWVRPSHSSSDLFERLVSGSRVDSFVGSHKTCDKHRKMIVRGVGALWEVDFRDDGGVGEVVPTVNKGQSWWTLYWLAPGRVDKDEEGAWLANGRALGQMVRGVERLPKMPKKLRDLTLDNGRDSLAWEMQAYGYSKVFLRSIGETVVVVRDDEVVVPKGYDKGVPMFTLEELVKLRSVVGMKPDPEMIQGVWLLKKHLGVKVVQ